MTRFQAPNTDTAGTKNVLNNSSGIIDGFNRYSLNLDMYCIAPKPVWIVRSGNLAQIVKILWAKRIPKSKNSFIFTLTVPRYACFCLLFSSDIIQKLRTLMLRAGYRRFFLFHWHCTFHCDTRSSVSWSQISKIRKHYRVRAKLLKCYFLL